MLQVPVKEEARTGEEGQSLLEYGLIVFLITILAILILTKFGSRIGSMFSSMAYG